MHQPAFWARLVVLAAVVCHGNLSEANGSQAKPRCETLFTNEASADYSDEFPVVASFKQALVFWNANLSALKSMGALKAASQKHLRLVVRDDVEDGQSFLPRHPSNGTLPFIQITDQERTLVLSRSFLKASAQPEELILYFRQLLVGQTLHPFVSELLATYNSASLTRGQAQREGQKAAFEAQQVGLKKFLYDSPSKEGNRDVLIETLNQRAYDMPHKLHIVAVQSAAQVRELEALIRKKIKYPVRVIHWTGMPDDEPIQDIIEKTQASAPPTILVTEDFVMGLRLLAVLPRSNSSATSSEASRPDVSKILATLAYHDLNVFESAYERKSVRDPVFDAFANHLQSDCFILGTVQSPVPPASGLYADFDGARFSAFLDTADSFKDRIHAAQSFDYHDFGSKLSQVLRAVKAGDLAPLSQFHILEPRYITDVNHPTPWRVDQPDVFARVSKDLRSLFSRHRRALIVVGSAKEGAQIARFLKDELKIRAEAFHSGLSEKRMKKFKKDFESYAIDTAIIVAGTSIPEGFDYAQLKLSLYVDLIRSQNIEDALRVAVSMMRIREGIESVEFAAALDFSELNAYAAAQLINQIRNLGFAGANQSARELTLANEARNKDIITNLRSLLAGNLVTPRTPTAPSQSANQPFMSMEEAQRARREGRR